jgi:plasmid stability protein
MKSIHIRNVEPATIERLKRLARIHRRSLQGELHVVLDHVARLAPAEGPVEPLNLVTVKAGGKTTWRREEVYNDRGR